MQNGEENQSNAGSEFERADMEDFEDEVPQPNVGGQMDSTFGQSSASDWRNIQNELAKAQFIALQNKCALLEEKCARLEEKMENVKLKGMLKEEKDSKKIEKLERDLVASQQNVEELKEATKEQFESIEMKMEEAVKKLEEANNKRAEEDKIAHDTLKNEFMACQQKMEEQQKTNSEQIEQLKRDLMASQEKIAEQEKAMAAKKFHLSHPKMNKWNGTGTQATISDNGQSASYTSDYVTKVFAIIPFSVNQHKPDGILIAYYEVTTWVLDSPIRSYLRIGLSADKQNGGCVGDYANSFAINPFYWGVNFYFSGFEKEFEWPSGAARPTIGKGHNVFGCGVLAWPDGKRAIFFTANGKRLGCHIPISNDVPLYPAVTLGGIDRWTPTSVEANFGDNLAANPFEYDITNCPGLDLNKQ